ncbi:Molecular chaperone (HSP90 family), partial [Pseudoloma neurophilia]
MLIVFFLLSIIKCENKEKYQLRMDKELINNVTTKLISDEFTCLRELISNSKDAFEKLAKIKGSAAGFETKRDVNIIITENTGDYDFMISDSGIGMSKQDLIDFIGSMGGSGTRQMDNKGELFVGQFGMGFYSTFVIADKVKIISRKFDTNETHEMEFSGDNIEYTIEKVDNSLIEGESGTEIQMRVRDSFKSSMEKEK